jgi:hypothetical protein
MEYHRSPVLVFLALPPRGPNLGDLSEPRPPRRSSWPTAPRHRAYHWRHMLESLAGGSAPCETRQSLLPQRLVIMFFAAGASRGRQLPVRAPGEEPRLHIFMLDVVARLHLTIGLTNLRQHPFLVSDIGLDRVGDEKVRASPGHLGQPGQPLFGIRLQADAEGRASCVRHEHILARARYASFSPSSAMPIFDRR